MKYNHYFLVFSMSILKCTMFISSFSLPWSLLSERDNTNIEYSLAKNVYSIKIDLKHVINRVG